MKLTIFYSPIYLSLLAVVWPLSIVQAQIIPDNTLGSENSVVTPNVIINGIDSDRIDGGAVRGSNLFQSFQEFNVGEGRGAYFSNPAGITDIFSRVTGGNISQILGTLGVSGNANLYFLNPNGILFGPNARLDVKGSFLATTADSIIFDNNYEFSASNPTAPPLLTVNIPIGLRFRENAGDIVVQTEGVINNIAVTEEGDAGSLTSDAQTANTANTETPNSISGNLLENNDADLYQIYLPEGTTITPSTVDGSEVDTRLFLFDQNGLGISANDDNNDTYQSTLPVVNQAGTYYLGVSSYANAPLSANGEIFAYSGDPNYSFTGPGIGANSPLSGWDNSGSASGSYTVSLRPPSTRSLAVSPGKTLALIGGDIRFEGGKIISPGSNVYLGSVKANGVVPLSGGILLVLPDNLTKGDITTINSSLIDVSSQGDFDGGNITLVGNNIATGDLLSFSSNNSRNGGAISLVAGGNISTG